MPVKKILVNNIKVIDAFWTGTRNQHLIQDSTIRNRVVEGLKLYWNMKQIHKIDFNSYGIALTGTLIMTILNGGFGYIVDLCCELEIINDYICSIAIHIKRAVEYQPSSIMTIYKEVKCEVLRNRLLTFQNGASLSVLQYLQKLHLLPDIIRRNAVLMKHVHSTGVERAAFDNKKVCDWIASYLNGQMFPTNMVDDDHRCWYLQKLNQSITTVELYDYRVRTSAHTPFKFTEYDTQSKLSSKLSIIDQGIIGKKEVKYQYESLNAPISKIKDGFTPKVLKRILNSCRNAHVFDLTHFKILSEPDPNAYVEPDVITVGNRLREHDIIVNEMMKTLPERCKEMYNTQKDLFYFNMLIKLIAGTAEVLKMPASMFKNFSTINYEKLISDLKKEWEILEGNYKNIGQSELSKLRLTLAARKTILSAEDFDDCTKRLKEWEINDYLPIGMFSVLEKKIEKSNSYGSHFDYRKVESPQSILVKIVRILQKLKNLKRLELNIPYKFDLCTLECIKCIFNIEIESLKEIKFKTVTQNQSKYMRNSTSEMRPEILELASAKGVALDLSEFTADYSSLNSSSGSFSFGDGGFSFGTGGFSFGTGGFGGGGFSGSLL